MTAESFRHEALPRGRPPRPMRRALLAGAMLTAAATSVAAADLPYRDPAARYGSAYDDPRYADLYGEPPPVERRYVPPYHPPYQPPRYGYADPPIPRAPVYPEPRPSYGPRNYADAYPARPRAYAYGPACLGKDEVRYQLERDGWRDFHAARILDQGVALVRARRHGRLFELKVDRCSGDVVMAQPLEPRHGPYADYDERPYRSYRTY